jgi:hypothetical protein
MTLTLLALLPALAAPTATPSSTPSSSGSTCSLVGNWEGTLPPGPQPWNGKAVTFEAKADGALIASGPMGPRPASWEMSGGVLTISKSTATGPGACENAAVGHYNVIFATDCSTFEAKLVDDTCTGRHNGFDGVVYKRKG